jgi:hypothetical protein
MQLRAAPSCGDVATVRRRDATVCPRAATPTAPAAATIQPVSAADLGPSWRPGCPLDPRHLPRVEVNHIGFDGKTHRGHLIVHEDLAADVVAIFEQLLQLCYRSRRSARWTTIRAPTMSCPWNTTTPRSSTAETFPAPAASLSTHSVEPSTSIRCSTRTSIGRGAFQPKNAAPYLDRNRTDPGVLHARDAAVRVFTDRG